MTKRMEVRLEKLEKDIGSVKTDVAVMKEQIKEHCDNQKLDLDDLKTAVNSLVKNVTDLTTNHIVFKTRVIAYWVVGTAVLTALLQLLISYIIKHI